MLVLSRRPHEKIAFPSLGISVEILRVDGRTVRVGHRCSSIGSRDPRRAGPRGEAGRQPGDRRLASITICGDA